MEEKKSAKHDALLDFVWCCCFSQREDITNVHAADICLLLPQTQSEDIANVHAADICLLLPQTQSEDIANVNAAAIGLLLPHATVKMV